MQGSGNVASARYWYEGGGSLEPFVSLLNLPLFQDLAHQLQNAVAEIQARASWAPWISKTLSSIKEAANNKMPSQVSSSGSGSRRESAPVPHHLPSHKLRTSSSVEWYPQDIERPMPASVPAPAPVETTVPPLSPPPVLESIPPTAANSI